MGFNNSKNNNTVQKIKFFKSKTFNKTSTFSKKINNNIFINFLMPFLSIEDYKELIKVDKYFYNNIIQYFNSYLKYINDLKNMYKLKIYSNEIDLSIESTINNNRFYKCLLDNAHYIKFLHSGIEHIYIFEEDDWAWKDDSRYWIIQKNDNSLIGEKLVKLISVCWIDINIQMSKIPKGKYKLYIRHGVFKFSEEKLKLIIKLNGQIIYDEKYIKKYMIDDCKLNEMEGKIENSFITDIIINNDFNDICINFKHLDLSWKYNWILDALFLY